MPRHFGRLRRRVLLLLSLVMLAAEGCLPQEQWLDDSSGFVYSVGKNETTQEIRFYDMARRTERVVWSGSNQAGFDVNSVDDVLYLLEPKRGAGKPLLSYRLSVYGIKTSRLQRSTRWMPWAGNDPDASRLFLSKLPNRQSHFLITDAGRGSCIRNAILNADTESLIDVPPGFDLEIIPDGSGFLARKTSVAKTWEDSLRSKKNLDARAIEELCRESIWMVDLNGPVHRMTWDESALRSAVVLYGEELKKFEASRQPEKVTCTGLLSNERSKWQGIERGERRGSDATTLLLGHEHGAMQIDIRRRTVTDVGGVTVAESDKGPKLSPALDSGPSVLLVKLKDVEYRLNILEKPAGKRTHYVANLEVRWRAEGNAKTLLNRVNIAEISRFSKASPNGLYAVLKYEEPEKEQSEKGRRIHYLVVDNEAKMLDRLFFHHIDRLPIEIEVEVPDDVPKEQR